MRDLVEKIKAAYMQEQLHQVPPVSANDLPLSYEAITDEWLTNVICRNHPGTKVIAHRLDIPDEGNTSRRRIFIEYNDAGKTASLPASVFCKATHHLSSRISGGATGAMKCEVDFYNKIRPLLDIEASEAIWANYDSVTHNSIVMLRDIGAGTEFCTLNTDMTDARLHGQMDLMAKYHGRFYQSADFDQVMSGFLTWPEYFAGIDRAIDLEQLCANGFRAAKEVIPPRLFARESEVWPATLASVDLHRDLPHTLIHCDVHLRNWYVRANGEVGLSDWKAWRGHWSRDVAYALSTAMSVERRRQLEKILLRHYLKKFGETGGVDHDFDTAMLQVRQQLFSVLAWWTVTLTPSSDMPDMQPRDVTLEMIKRISHAIDDLEALDSFI